MQLVFGSFRDTKSRDRTLAGAVRLLVNVVEEDAVEIAEINRITQTHVPENSSGGVAVLVTRNGDVLHRRGCDSSGGRPNTCQTRLSRAAASKRRIVATLHSLHVEDHHARDFQL